LDQIQVDVKSEIEKGMQFGIDTPYPNVDEVDEDVYA
jgi:TPP-dependent pyruvate/acetoin dehydrogenase alpha subunit